MTALLADIEIPNYKETYHVLIVDDNEMDREYFSSLLEKSTDAEFEITTAASLKEAMNFISRTEGINAILLDYQLTDGTAEDLIKELSGHPESPAIIVFTGFNDNSKALDLLLMGAHDYLDKSKVTNDNLYRAVRFGIERSRGLHLKQQLLSERQLNSMQSDFISIISHDFKNPIHVINSSVEVIRKKISSHLSVIEKYLVNITTSTARMDHMLDMTAEFATFNPNTLKVKAVSSSLYTLTNQEINRFQSLHPTRDFLVGSSLAIIPNVMIDPKLCGQVLQNVIGNAVKFSQEDKPINFLFTVTTDSVMLQVQDHGIGIPATELDKITQKFYRASNSADMNGTGMGLYLVRSLMKLMKGKFQIQSREGKGTVVTLTFPRA